MLAFVLAAHQAPGRLTPLYALQQQGIRRAQVRP